MSRLAHGGLGARLLTATARLRLWYLLTHHHSRSVMVIGSLANSGFAIGILGLGAWWTQWPLIFPSLGPSAFLFFSAPSRPAAWPRSALLGHALGVAAGWSALCVFGLLDAGPAILTGVDGWRVGAAALSLAMVSASMVALDCPHPPAASTALIVSLGLMTSWGQLAVLMGAVVLLTAQAWVLNRLGGIAYPLWRARGPALATGQPDLATEIAATALDTQSTPTPDRQDTYRRVADRLVIRRGWNLPG